MKSNKLLTQQQETQQIPEELVQKFDNDKELVQEFLNEGYSVQELQASIVTHPTRYDPIVMLGDRTLGFWMDGGKKYQEDSRTYQDRRNRFF